MTDDMALRVSGLREGQGVWGARSVAERLEPVRRLRGIVSGRADAVARVIAGENGKTPFEALTQEVMPLLDSCLFLENRAAGILADAPLEFESRLFSASRKDARMTRSPYGVIGILGTWNYPFFLNLSQTLFALVAGNAVYLKCSELSPRVAELIAQLLREAGFDPALTRVTAGGADEGRALTEAGCDKYLLTGGREAGRAVLAALARELKPAVVELSGSDPYLIFSDADWKLAARTLVWTAFQYSGQTCVAPRRVIVLERDRERFLEAFRAAAGAAKEFVMSQGRLRTARFTGIERAKIEALKRSGARLIWTVESDAAESDAEQVRPQLWEVTNPDAAAETDWMSPVLLLLTAPDEDGMLRLARRTPLGLGASVWTRSRARAERAARAVRAGQVWVNDTLYTTALGEAPFGGAGASGWGRTRGPEGLLEMTEAKLVSRDFRRFRATLHLPPYLPQSYTIVRHIQQIWFGTRLTGRLAAVWGLVRACLPHDPSKKK